MYMTSDALYHMPLSSIIASLQAAAAERSAVPLVIERLLSAVQICCLLWAYGVRRSSTQSSDCPLRDCIAGVVGTLGLVLFDHTSQMPSRLAADVLLPLCTAVLALRVYSVLSLGRSFGVRAANRGIVVSGAYRVVRHPIYAAYLASSVLQCSLHATAWNVAVVACSCGVHVWRIRCEEELLTRSAEYRGYMAKVRWRLVPGLY